MSYKTKNIFNLKIKPCKLEIVLKVTFDAMIDKLDTTCANVIDDELKVLHRCCFNGDKYYPQRLILVEHALSKIEVVKNYGPIDIDEDKNQLWVFTDKEYNTCCALLEKIKHDITYTIDKLNINRN